MKQPTIHTDPVLSGKVCAYCGKPTQYVDSSVVYGESFGMIYMCKPCKAWVGVHKGTNIALGRVADATLREAKKAAHYYFDALWRKRLAITGDSQSRSKAYKWLSEQMNKPASETHIGMFNLEECYKVVELCEKYVV